MSGFSDHWLALREEFDRAARAISAEALGLRTLRGRLAPEAPALRVVDLACGTGSNLRLLAPRLGGDQQWLLVDQDEALLAALPRRMGVWARGQGLRVDEAAESGLRIAGPGWQAHLETRRLDLARNAAAVPFDGVQLVTASALLDLVSADWFDALTARAARAGAAMLFALDVDGRVAWEPCDEADAEVLALFARHQVRDKGFGPALGPQAAAHASARLRSLGHAVTPASSDWLVEGGECPLAADLQRAFIDGVAKAAGEVDAAARERIEAWRVRRLARVEVSSLEVGHCDTLALPSSARR